MEVFRLPDLDLTLLEKVIAKLDQTSYFRMQQTCKDIQQFIRKNKNISIHLDGEKHYPFTRIAQRVHYNWIECLPKLEFDKIGNSYKLNFGTHRHPSHCLELADFYGTRLPHIQLSNGIEDCQRICDTLKKYQITTQAIWVSGKDWSREDVLLVLNIVKPYRILLDVYEYELLFQFKSIKEVVINLHEEDVTIAIPKLLDAFPDIDITIENVENEVELIRTCVQSLQSQPRPNLGLLSVDVYGGGYFFHTSIAELKSIFPKFNITEKRSHTGYLHDGTICLTSPLFATTSHRVTITTSNFSTRLICE